MKLGVFRINVNDSKNPKRGNGPLKQRIDPLDIIEWALMISPICNNDDENGKGRRRKKKREKKKKEKHEKNVDDGCPIYLIDSMLYRHATIHWLKPNCRYNAEGKIDKKYLSDTFLMGCGVIKFTQRLKKNEVYPRSHRKLLECSEFILQRILPGGFRLIKNLTELISRQSKFYMNTIIHIKNVDNKKMILNSMDVFKKLKLDGSWQGTHSLVNWPTLDQISYYLNIILRYYIFREKCGYVTHDGDSRDCVDSVDPIEHILGLMYSLKDGYKKTVVINGLKVGIEIIPKDIYLNKYGILLEKNKLSKYVTVESRNLQKTGCELFKKLIDFGLGIMSPNDLRSVLFPP